MPVVIPAGVVVKIVAEVRRCGLDSPSHRRQTLEELCALSLVCRAFRFASQSCISSCVRIKPGSYQHPWIFGQRLLSQNHVLPLLRSFVLEFDVFAPAGSGCIETAARYYLGHPNLAVIFGLLRAARRLDRVELDLGQSADRAITIPWDFFLDTGRAIEGFIEDWQGQRYTGNPGTLVLRFIEEFPFRTQNHLGRLHLEYSSFSFHYLPHALTRPAIPRTTFIDSLILLNSPAAGAFLCSVGAELMSFSRLKELRISVANIDELKSALSLLNRVFFSVKRVVLSFRYFGEFSSFYACHSSFADFKSHSQLWIFPYLSLQYISTLSPDVAHRVRIGPYFPARLPDSLHYSTVRCSSVSSPSCGLRSR